MDTKMNSIKIDDKEYDLDQISDEAKAQLVNLQYVDSELQRLNAQVAVLKTARMAYGRALNESLEEKKITKPRRKKRQ